VEVADEKLMFRLIRASFNQRRKTLVNALTNSSDLPYTKEQVIRVVEMCGLKPAIRGEALELSDFARLSNIFSG
jgi:16S rRNA (adenine1518-N6/adenine1519-N6)-dimethyltransferase